MRMQFAWTGRTHTHIHSLPPEWLSLMPHPVHILPARTIAPNESRTFQWWESSKGAPSIKANRAGGWGLVGRRTEQMQIFFQCQLKDILAVCPARKGESFSQED